MREESWELEGDMKGNLVRLLQEGSDLEKMIQLTLAVEIVDTFVPGLFSEKKFKHT